MANNTPDNLSWSLLRCTVKRGATSFNIIVACQFHRIDQTLATLTDDSRTTLVDISSIWMLYEGGIWKDFEENVIPVSSISYNPSQPARA